VEHQIHEAAPGADVAPSTRKNSAIYMCPMSNLYVNYPVLGDLELRFTPLAADDLIATWQGKLGTSLAT
jgi:hypothetical protein